MISASKNTLSLNNLEILMPKVTKNITNLLKKFLWISTQVASELHDQCARKSSSKHLTPSVITTCPPCKNKGRIYWGLGIQTGSGSRYPNKTGVSVSKQEGRNVRTFRLEILNAREEQLCCQSAFIPSVVDVAIPDWSLPSHMDKYSGY
jgi:hypothetical protein